MVVEASRSRRQRKVGPCDPEAPGWYREAWLRPAVEADQLRVARHLTEGQMHSRPKDPSVCVEEKVRRKSLEQLT